MRLLSFSSISSQTQSNAESACGEQCNNQQQMLSPQEKKRQQMLAIAKKEEEMYQKYLDEHTLKYVNEINYLGGS